MLTVQRDDTKPKQEAAHRASDVPALPVQQHRRNYRRVFEACSSVWQGTVCTQSKDREKQDPAFPRVSRLNFHFPISLRLFPRKQV